MKEIRSFQELFQNYLEQVQWSQAPKELYEPVRYLMHLGGKRLRPLLTLIAYSLFAKDLKKALPVAMAVEIFHNFSLVHDDIMDNAPLRRGHPTVHTRYNINTAILSGDVMLVYCYEYLLALDDAEKIRKMVAIFNKAAIQVCEGQQYDMNFENRQDVTLPEYLNMIRGKTAALISASLALGAVAAGAPDADVAHLEAFGENIGIAFQLQDDYLDTFGEPEKVGKKPGGDIVQNKKTFLILRALESADADTRQRLIHLLNTPTTAEAEKISSVTEILHSLDIPALTLQRKQEFQQIAFHHLEQLSSETAGKDLLRNLSLDLIGRES